MQERIIRLGPGGTFVEPSSINARQGGHPNRVRTQLFSWSTWLPRSIGHEFTNVVNWYLLVVIIVSALVPGLHINWKLSGIMFAVSLLSIAFKDLYEDHRRSPLDAEVNSTPCWKFSATGTQCTTRDKLVVGDLVHAAQGESFPADVVLIGHPLDQTVYIEGANLDGEGGWKARTSPDNAFKTARQSYAARLQEPVPIDAVPKTSTDASRLIAKPNKEATLMAQCIFSGGFTLFMDGPSDEPWHCKGTLSTGSSCVDITDRNFVPKGCVLHGCPWVLGIITYAGVDTKSRIIDRIPRLKKSALHKYVDYCMSVTVFILALISYTFCFVSSLLGHVDPLNFLRWIALLQPALPFFLRAAEEFYRFLMTTVSLPKSQMSCEDAITNKFVRIKTTRVITDLGQLGHVFVDKTGTLTYNNMRLARVNLPGGRDPGNFHSGSDCIEDFASEGSRAVANLIRADPCELTDKERLERENSVQAFLGMALCHNLNVQHKNGIVTYIGPSAEEIAFAVSARAAGITFHRRGPESGGSDFITVTIQGPRQYKRRYRVVATFPFDSMKKRMTIVVQNMDDKEDIACITKGADCAVERILTDGEFSPVEKRFIHTQAGSGNRTMAFTHRTLSREFLRNWETAYIAAKAASDERKLTELVDDIEKGHSCSCLIALMDQIQNGVTEAIETIQKTGVKFWMVTGDKTETAISVAYQCGAIPKDSEVLRFDVAMEIKGLNGSDKMAAALAAEQWLMRQVSGSDSGNDGHRTLVFDGNSLNSVLNTKSACQSLCELASTCTACICARMDPKQKETLVEMLRDFDSDALILAIGDGANDVPMIASADVGVGVAVSSEGDAEACQRCDVQVPKFSCLVPLMMTHGMHSYKRVAMFVMLFVHKSFMGIFPLIFVSCVRSLRIPDKPVLVPLIEAMWVVHSTLIMFVPLSEDFLVPAKNTVDPSLYKVGKANAYFNGAIYSSWVFHGCVDGAIGSIVPFLSLSAIFTVHSDYFISAGAMSTFIYYLITFFHLACYTPSRPSQSCTWVKYVPHAVAGGFTYIPSFVGVVVGNSAVGDIFDIYSVFCTQQAFYTFLLTTLVICIVRLILWIVAGLFCKGWCRCCCRFCGPRSRKRTEPAGEIEFAVPIFGGAHSPLLQMD